MTGDKIDTSKPYTGTVIDAMCEPRANLGADRECSIGRLKTRKGGLGKVRVIKENDSKKRGRKITKGSTSIL